MSPSSRTAGQPVPAVSAPVESAPALLFAATRGAVVSTVTVVILTVFILAGGPPMLARMTSASVSDLKSAQVIDVIEQVRREVGRFYVTTALINAGLGLATGDRGPDRPAASGRPPIEGGPESAAIPLRGRVSGRLLSRPRKIGSSGAAIPT
jgi:hypothetical protein